jgi:hypothetical protein
LGETFPNCITRTDDERRKYWKINFNVLFHISRELPFFARQESLLTTPAAINSTSIGYHMSLGS